MALENLLIQPYGKLEYVGNKIAAEVIAPSVVGNTIATYHGKFENNVLAGKIGGIVELVGAANLAASSYIGEIRAGELSVESLVAGRVLTIKRVAAKTI